MNCCQCQGIEELFSQKLVNRELSHYRAKGPDKTTRILTEAIKERGVEGLSLLDIGGGVGAVQYDLLGAGVQNVTGVDASAAYLSVAKSEAERQGYASSVSYRHGDFIDVAEEITPADIVTLDRVICCYPNMEKLVDLSAKRARRLYGLVYPRDVWWIKIGLAVANFFLRMRHNPFRGYIHHSEAVEAVLSNNGLKRLFFRRTMLWQVVVYCR
jgi:predicted TPR repeat methyltransferase